MYARIEIFFLQCLYFYCKFKYLNLVTMKPFLPLQPLLLALLFAIPALSQSTTGKVEYQKGQKMSASVELPYSPEVVQEAIKDFLSKRSTKNDRSKGFDIYRYTKLHDGDPELHDVHCRVIGKGKKDAESIVHILIGRPGENIGVHGFEPPASRSRSISPLSSVRAPLRPSGPLASSPLTHRSLTPAF